LASHPRRTPGCSESSKIGGGGIGWRRAGWLSWARCGGLSVERGRDAIWTLNSVEVWSLLTEQRGWSAEEYEEWVGRAMADAVLEPAG